MLRDPGLAESLRPRTRWRRASLPGGTDRDLRAARIELCRTPSWCGPDRGRRTAPGPGSWLAVEVPGAGAGPGPTPWCDAHPPAQPPPRPSVRPRGARRRGGRGSPRLARRRRAPAAGRAGSRSPPRGPCSPRRPADILVDPQLLGPPARWRLAGGPRPPLPIDTAKLPSARCFNVPEPLACRARVGAWLDRRSRPPPSGRPPRRGGAHPLDAGKRADARPATVGRAAVL